jgi:hypothetical protein
MAVVRNDSTGSAQSLALHRVIIVETGDLRRESTIFRPSTAPPIVDLKPVLGDIAGH